MFLPSYMHHDWGMSLDEEMWGLILQTVTERVYRDLCNLFNSNNYAVDGLRNPYLPKGFRSKIAKMSKSDFERFKARKNFMQAFGQIVVESDKNLEISAGIPTYDRFMARALYSHALFIWIKNNAHITKDSVDRMMFFTHWCKYFITAAIHDRLGKEISQKELGDHACGVNLIPLCEHLSAEDIAYNIVEQDLVNPMYYIEI